MFAIAQILGFLLLSVPTGVPESAPAVPGVISQLIGQWEGEGELFAQPAKFGMTWEWELDKKFVRLQFENWIVADGQERPVLRATAYYQLGDPERLEGAWFDSRGQIITLKATVLDATLVTHWFAESEQGRTSYRVTGPDTIEVQDEVQVEDGWRVFGNASYRRQSTRSPSR